MSKFTKVISSRLIFSLLLLNFTPALYSSAHADALKCEHLPVLFEAYFRGHYEYKSLSKEVRDRTVEQFIKAIDPSKTLLLEEDVNKLKKTLATVFDTMKDGNCSGLDEAFDMTIARSKENEELVKKVLADHYKLDETVQLNLDPDQRGYPKNKSELEDLVHKMIHFQISNYLLTEMKLPEAEKQLAHRYELVSKRLSERKNDAVTTFAASFALALDPHSSYLSQDDLEDFQITMHLSLEGIGASLSSQDGFTVIEETIPGGGAEKTKVLRPKDKIIAVAQEGQKPISVIDMDLRDVVKMIRGKKGTKVRLTILRQGTKTETFDVTIVRDKIDIKDQAAKITYETRKVGNRKLKIGVIDLPSFYGGEEGGRSCSNDIKDLLDQAKQQKVDGLVLDLSKNGGGLLEEAVRISGFFIQRGNVVATKDSEKNVQKLADDDDEVVWKGPLIVLTSRLSASASEIFAGAMKDYHRALIVGSDHTFGKGTVQAVSKLPLNLGAIKVTTGMFFIPAGKSTQHLGVASDVQVPSVFDNDDVGEKQLDYSLPPQSIPAFLSADANSLDPSKHWTPVSASLVEKLSASSHDRVTKNPKFADIEKELKEAAKNKGVIRLSDIRKRDLDEMKKEEKLGKNATKSEREQKLKDMDAPVIQESVNIMTDWITSQTQG